jgi:uncharacterized protein (TIGR00251 family)
MIRHADRATMAAMAGAERGEFEVHVRPGSSRTAVGGEHDGRLVVRVTAPAIDGRANDAVVRALADALGVARSHVTIVGGVSSRRKRICMTGDTDALPARLDSLRRDVTRR